MIKNPETGEMTELSSVTEETRDRWNEREEMKGISISDALILFKAADPNAEEVELNKELARKATKLQNKMLAGNRLTTEEKDFLQANFPQLAKMADRMEQEALQLEARLKGTTSKEEAKQVYMNTKATLLDGMSENDGAMLFLSAILDKVYAQHTGQKQIKIDTRI